VEDLGDFISTARVAVDAGVASGADVRVVAAGATELG
jgi:hypothetical protein